MYTLSKKSLAKLEGVHPDMQKLVNTAICLSTIDFGISEGLRTRERQQLLFDQGKSLTLNSKHLKGLAVDVYAWIDGGVSWNFEHYERINLAFSRASTRIKIPYVWGGTWTRLKDGPHFELTEG